MTRSLHAPENGPAAKSSQSTCLSSPLSSVLVTTKEALKTENSVPETQRFVIRAEKVLLKPTTAQRKVLNKWFGVSRFVYNQALAEVRKSSTNLNKKRLRELFVKGCSALLSNRGSQWLREVPFEVRDEAVRDLLANYKTNLAKRAKDSSHTFTIQFKRKREDDSICLQSKNWNDGQLFKTYLPGRLRGTERIPASLQHGGRILRTGCGEFFITLNRDVSVPCLAENQDQAKEHSKTFQKRVVSIDPGLRTFLTCYDPRGAVVEFGAGDRGHMLRTHHHLQGLLSRIAGTADHRRRCRMARAARRMRQRLHDMVRDVHYRAANWLVKNYDVIVLGKLEVSRLVCNGSSVLSKDNKKALLSWCHYQFRQRLLSKAEEHGKIVHVCDESYTSKTCGSCGRLNQSLGSSKTFRCRACGQESDRDFHAARNIFIKEARAVVSMEHWDTTPLI